MALFKRNKQKTIAELEEYYANQNQSKSGAMAWLMAILSLLITVAVISLLFFGGRWIYRTITDDEDTSTSTSSNESNQKTTQDSSTNSNNTGATNEGVVSDEAASTSTSNAGTVSGATVNPTTGPLPNTGPDLDL